MEMVRTGRVEMARGAVQAQATVPHAPLAKAPIKDLGDSSV
jgi:hypothetical protein